MTTELEQEALANQLADPDPGNRLEAARRLLELAKQNHSLNQAAHDALSSGLDDADLDVRVTAALALLRPSRWTLHPALAVLESQYLSDDGTVRDGATSALVRAAELRRDSTTVGNVLLPQLLYAYDAADGSPRRAVVLEAIAGLSKHEIDLQPALERLINGVGDRSWTVVGLAATGLRAAASRGTDITPAVPALQTGLARGRRSAKLTRATVAIHYECASTLARIAVMLQNGQMAEGLLADSCQAVREGAAAGLREANVEDLEPFVGTLAIGLGDANEAVLFHVLKTLRRAAEAGIDISEAHAGLEQTLGKSSYEGTGWVFGVDMILSSDLGQEHPDGDALAALVLDAVNKRDEERLRALFRHERQWVGRGVRHQLERLAAEPDEVRRRWIERLAESF